MKEKIKILHIGLSSNHGGLESFVRNIYESMDKEKFQFDFVDVSEGNLCFHDYYKSCGCQIFQIAPRKKHPIKSYRQLKKLFKENKYDYIHCHMMIFSWVEPIIAASKFSDAKIIIHSHTAKNKYDTDRKEKILHAIGKFRIRKIKHLNIACGTKAGEWLFPGEEFTIVENGINLEKYEYNPHNRKEIREKYNIKENEFLIGHVGNFSYPKNCPFLVEFFNEYYKKNSNARLMMVGNGTGRKDIENMVEEMNIKDKVIFTGAVSDVQKYYSAMDIFFFPSFYEGLSIALIEAQASGLSCFTTAQIDRECDVSGNITFFSLEDSIESIIGLIDKSKKDRNVEMKKNYDISQSSSKMLGVYLENKK